MNIIGTVPEWITAMCLVYAVFDLIRSNLDRCRKCELVKCQHKKEV